jgi:hypothetical protein
MSSTLHEMIQHTCLRKYLHVNSDKKGDWYFNERNQIHLIEKQEATQSQGHENLYNIKSQVTLTELDCPGQMVTAWFYFAVLQLVEHRLFSLD